MHLKELSNRLSNLLKIAFEKIFGTNMGKFYPRHLLPKPNYKIISQENLYKLKNLWLIRHQTGKLQYWEATNTINPKCIEFNSDQLRDLSNNLLGRFRIEDIYWQFDKKSENFSLFIDLWKEGKKVKRPNWDDCNKNENINYYFIPVDSLLTNQFDYTNGQTLEKRTFHYQILHTPTNCNFWHISIRVYDEKGLEISNSDKYSKNQLNKIFRRAKSHLSQKIITDNIPKEYTTIPQNLYLKGA